MSRRPPGAAPLIVDLLNRQGMTQAELARLTRLTPKHVNQICLGKARLTVATACTMAKVLGVRPERLVWAEAEYLIWLHWREADGGA